MSASDLRPSSSGCGESVGSQPHIKGPYRLEVCCFRSSVEKSSLMEDCHAPHCCPFSKGLQFEGTFERIVNASIILRFSDALRRKSSFKGAMECHKCFINRMIFCRPRVDPQDDSRILLSPALSRARVRKVGIVLFQKVVTLSSSTLRYT